MKTTTSLRPQTLDELAEMICGTPVDADGSRYFEYRPGQYLPDFFQRCGYSIPWRGGARKPWVRRALRRMLATTDNASEPLAIIVSRLMESEWIELADGRPLALAHLNASLRREGFEVIHEGEHAFRLVSVAGPVPTPSK